MPLCPSNGDVLATPLHNRWKERVSLAGQTLTPCESLAGETRSEWWRLWDLLGQFEGDPLVILGEAEVVPKSLLLLQAKPCLWEPDQFNHKCFSISHE